MIVKKLLLFDIDGTLVQNSDLVRYGISNALKHVFGTTGPLDDYEMSGRTDPQIMRELMSMAGIEEAIIENKLMDVCDEYVNILNSSISQFKVMPCPGVIALLDEISEKYMKETIIGLLTGNLKDVVGPKLRAAGINENFFKVGAFGSDNSNRNMLPMIAMERAVMKNQTKLNPDNVIIIGDTPRDISCARYAGIKVLSVASGKYSSSLLRTYRPDFLFEDLTDIFAITEVLGLQPTRN